jgi:hypothetical protein
MAVLVTVETRDQRDYPLYEGRLTGEFPSRKAAVEAVKRHLRQFDRTGFDDEHGCWWGAAHSAPRMKTLFFIKHIE